MEKVVVLGSSGFVGSALLSSLGSYNQVEAVGYDSSKLDLAREDAVAKLDAVLDGDSVLVIAVRARAANQGLTEDLVLSENIARCLGSRKIKRCVFFSTLSVYGDRKTDLAITEATAIDPTSHYGTVKFAGESLVRIAAEETGTPLLVFRPCKIYGPGDPTESYGPAGFIHSLIRKGEVTLYGDGMELRDHLYIDDLVAICSEAILGGVSGIFNLASGVSQSFREMVDVLAKIATVNFNIVEMARTRTKIDQGIDMTKLVEAIPGLRFTPLADGLETTYRYLTAKEGKKHSDG